MKVFLLISICFAVVSAQVPHRCVSPIAWDARIFLVDPSRRMESFARFSYDAHNERMSIREVVIEGHSREFFEDIFLYREKMGFRINARTRHCTKFTLLEPFRRIEVPGNATLYGAAYVGSSSVLGASVEVNAWGGETERGRYAGSWTSNGCVPVTDSYVSTRYGYMHWSFFDVTLGISDPNVFVPPTQCT